MGFTITANRSLCGKFEEQENSSSDLAQIPHNSRFGNLCQRAIVAD